MTRRTIKILSLLSALAILSISTGIIFHYLLKSSLPVYEGELFSSKIIDEVEIFRDQHAVPYIFTSSDEDAAFALGFLHAQERMFQMDIARRASEGRLSEIFGLETLNFDKMFLALGIAESSQKTKFVLPPETKKILESYSNGVNHFIKSKHLPIEFDVLGYEPYQWKPEHSIMLSKLMAWCLNMSWWTDFAYSSLVAKFGTGKVLEIIPDFTENQPVKLPPNLAGGGSVSMNWLETDKQFRAFIGFNGTHIGSNNWAVNGNRALLSKPIIANDPHLTLSAPSIWYAAVVNGKNWKAAGVTLPGIPAIIIGKNQNISWAVTNLMADDCDFYIEQADPSKKNYLLDGSWIPFQKKTFKIKIKGQPEEEFELKSTHRGPIISDIHTLKFMYGKDKSSSPLMSMRWIGSQVHDDITPLLSVNSSSDWKGFTQSLRDYWGPGQNFIYADANGNIGYVCAAKIPIRNQNNPTFVFDGSTSYSDWTGYIPYDQMPKIFNPQEGFIATANNKVDPTFQPHISNLWEPDSRIRRIFELLRHKDRHNIEDFKNYQMDLRSNYAKDMLPYILKAFEGIKITDIQLRTVLDLLGKWDFQMDPYSQTPAIFEVFFMQLLKNIYLDEMGQDIFRQYIFLANIPFRVTMKLLSENKSSWFDDIKTQAIENRDQIIRRSLSQALDQLEKDYGSEISNWQWGALHKLTLRHPFHGRASLIDNFTDIGPYYIGGNGTTLCNGEYSMAEPFDNVLGPSMRFIYDFSTPEKFYLILPTGQSGNVLAKNYRDMTEMWLTGKYITISTDEQAIRSAGLKLLKFRRSN